MREPNVESLDLQTCFEVNGPSALGQVGEGSALRDLLLATVLEAGERDSTRLQCRKHYPKDRLRHGRLEVDWHTPRRRGTPSSGQGHWTPCSEPATTSARGRVSPSPDCHRHRLHRSRVLRMRHRRDPDRSPSQGSFPRGGCASGTARIVLTCPSETFSSYASTFSSL